MRRPIVGMSMKIYRNLEIEEAEYCNRIVDLFGDEEGLDLFYCPSLGVLHVAAGILKGSRIELGAQNIAAISEGALTGEYSIQSLIDKNGKYVELGHAERRMTLNESDYLINRKLLLTLENGLIPLLCIGEYVKSSAELRSRHMEEQLAKALLGVGLEQIQNVIIAYEPVWAIGQAVSAEPDYVHESHTIIRSLLCKHYGSDIASQVRIIYGGSVSSENARDLISNVDVDGLFVGRFGHVPEQLFSIISSVREIKLES